MSAEDVYSILTKYNTSYIILEDSICMQAGRNKDRCSLPDTMDLTLGHVSQSNWNDYFELIGGMFSLRSTKITLHLEVKLWTTALFCLIFNGYRIFWVGFIISL